LPDALVEEIQPAGGGPIDPAPDFDALYEELRRLARQRLAELPPGQTLQPTALVHEAWLRLAGRTSPLPPGRRALMFLVTRAMRDLLVEDARRKGALKRGGAQARVPLEDGESAHAVGGEDVLAVDEALEALEHESPDAAPVVGLRYFGGLTVPEVAEALECSVSTVERQWAYARAWLRRRMDGNRST
jgi:RNA polymerase sigma factor (TIGR02999 family)